MNTLPDQHATQYRLARFYLDRLREAATAVGHGHTNVAYGLRLFDLEWHQIKYWLRWSAQHSADGEEWAHLCKDFPLAGREVLAVRTDMSDYAHWLETALTAAQQLGDSEAERAICHELRLTYYRLGVLDKVEYYASQLLRLGELANDPLSIGRGLHGLGTYAEERGRYAEAEQYYQRALQIFTDLGHTSEIGRELNALGSVALYVGDYPLAYHYCSRNMELMEAAGKKSELCTTLLSIGEVLTRQKDFVGAEKYTLRALNMCRTFGFQRLLGVGLINLGWLALEQDQPELAISHLQGGIAAVRAVHTQRQIIEGLSALGCARLRQGELAEALERLHEGLRMARAAGQSRYICNLQRTLADTYLALNDFGAARLALYEALAIAQSLNAHPQKVRTLSSAAAYAQRIGLHERAAVWVGRIVDDPEKNESVLAPMYLKLEAALGSESYRQALRRGSALTLDDVLSDALAVLEETGKRLAAD